MFNAMCIVLSSDFNNAFVCKNTVLHNVEAVIIRPAVKKRKQRKIPSNGNVSGKYERAKEEMIRSFPPFFFAINYFFPPCLVLLCFVL